MHNHLLKLAAIFFASATEARLGTRRSPGDRSIERVVTNTVEQSPHQPHIQRTLKEKVKCDKDKEKEKCDKEPKEPKEPKDPNSAPPPPPPHLVDEYANTSPQFGAGYESSNVFTQEEVVQTTQSETSQQMQQQQAIAEIQQATQEMQDTLEQYEQAQQQQVNNGGNQQQTQQNNNGNQKTQQNNSGGNQQTQQNTSGDNQNTQQNNSGGNQQTQQNNGGNQQQTQQSTNQGSQETKQDVFTPSEAEMPVAYSGNHIPKISSDLLTKVTECIADCDSDCTMFSVNTIYFDGLLDLNFPCLEKCMEDKQILCANVAMCQSKC